MSVSTLRRDRGMPGPPCAFAVLGLVAAAAAACAPLPTPVPVRATATLQDAHGRAVGTAMLREVPGAVRIVLELRGLAPGVKGVHIHEIGWCVPPDFTSAGGHFDRDGRQHGVLNPAGPHAGDLPNVTVETDGTGRLETTTNRVTLSAGPASILQGEARALVVHAGADDHQTDPAGNSGLPIACGLIVEEK